jgi:hypothetical protein
MVKAARHSLLKAILIEIFSSLPGLRRPTAYEPPEDPLDFSSESIYTGAQNLGKRIRIWERLLGITLWLLWFGFGIFFWWFTEVPILDYIIGVIVWGLIFLFTVVGIPITRAVLRHRERI